MAAPLVGTAPPDDRQASPGRVPDDARFVLDLLGGAPGEAGGLRWAAAGRLPDGFRRLERLVVMPAGGGRSFTMTSAAPRSMAAAVRAHGRLRSPRQRLARQVVAAGLAAGAVQRMPLPRVDLGAADGGGERTIGQHLAELLGAPEVMIAFGGGRGPYRKPVLQVFDTRGTPLAYAKVGWNEWSRRAVRREAASLRLAAGHAAGGSAGRGAEVLRVPALLAETSWHSLDIVLTAPLPAGARRLPLGSPLPSAGYRRSIEELSAVTRGALASSDWWSGIRDRIGRIGCTGCTGSTGSTGNIGSGDGVAARLDVVAASLEASAGSAELGYGHWHGDLVPWNLARRGDELWAWDWEDSAAGVPLGFDAVHFNFQVAFVGRRMPLGAAVRIAAERSRQATGEPGPGAPEGLVALLHLLELAVRHEEARASSRQADERFFPAVLAELEARA